MQNPNFIFSKGLGFLAWFLYFFILLLIDITNKKFVFLVGLIYGVLSYGLFTNWLINYDFLVWVVVFVVYGLFFGILFVLLKFIRSNFGKFSFLIQWTTICGFEYIKTKGFFGFSYGVSGYTQWNYSVLIQCAEFIGVFGLSALIIFPSVVLENIFYEYKSCKNVSKKFYYSLSTWFIIFVSFLIFGFVKLNKMQNKENNQTVKVAAIQNNENPFLSGIDIYTENVNELIRLTEKAFKENPNIDFVIWPETSVVPSIMLQYYNPTDKKREELIQNLLNYIESKNATFVIGNAHVEIDKINKKFYDYNSALVFTSKKNVIPPKPLVYSKNHLVPISESFPWKEKFPKVYDYLQKNGSSMWTQGKEINVFDINNFRFSTPICFEDTFGDICRKMRMNGAECFFNLSNDAWSKSLACQNQHLAMAIFRCVENKIPAVRSTSSGQTCIINQYGTIEEMCEPFCSSYLVGNVPITNFEQEEMTFYTKTGDLFGFVFFIFSLIMLLTKIFIGIIKTWQIRKLMKKEM